MNKQDVIRHFGGSQVKVADALGITKSAVSQWGDVIPEGIAYKLQVMTAGVLRVDPSMYESQQARSPAA